MAKLARMLRAPWPRFLGIFTQGHDPWQSQSLRKSNCCRLPERASSMSRRRTRARRLKSLFLRSMIPLFASTWNSKKQKLNKPRTVSLFCAEFNGNHFILGSSGAVMWPGLKANSAAG
jgi:hypothetical protein